MKHNGSYLRQFLPWLGLLLGVDALAALLLWLADAKAFAATAGVIVLATVFLFACVCAVLCARAKRREQAFTAFLTAPDTAHEQALCRLLSPAESQSVHLLGETLRAQQQTIAQLQTQMDDYEDYVELWAHEVKTPLVLLTLVLDNRRDTLPEAVGFKLDYVRNRMQAFIDQMLYYARLRGARRDYRFERLALRSCIDEVLDDYRPLLEEKHFRVELRLADETVFSDRRGLCFLLGQVVSNSVKYALEKPVLTFSLENGGTATVLSIRDNGPGVRACDLPYVFEKGFTGDSGHEKNKATGMGALPRARGCEGSGAHAQRRVRLGRRLCSVHLLPHRNGIASESRSKDAAAAASLLFAFPCRPAAAHCSHTPHCARCPGSRGCREKLD